MAPLTKWALDDIQQTLVIGGWVIQTTTDVPCHQWLRHTLMPPQKHAKPVERRGLIIAWDARFCFVAYQDLEQVEEGDTLTHTFVWTDWQICQTRWFYFWATIGGTLSPSTSCIFSKGFHPGEALFLICHSPEPHAGTTYIDHTLWGSMTFKPPVNFSIRQIHVVMYQTPPIKIPEYFRLFISPALPDGKPDSDTVITWGELIEPQVTEDPQTFIIPINAQALDALTPYSIWGYPGHWKDHWPDVAGVHLNMAIPTTCPYIVKHYRSADNGDTWDWFMDSNFLYHIYGTLL